MPEKFSPKLQLNRWIEGPYRITHHPLCGPFNGHTVNIFKKDVCRGCLFWYPGILFGLILGFIFSINWVDAIPLAILQISLVIPTLLQLIIHLPRKIKDLGRLLLGLATGFSILIVLMPGSPVWYGRLIVLFVFLLIFIPLTVIRNDKNEAICRNCPEFPLRQSNSCTGYKILLQRQTIVNTQLIIGISDVHESEVQVKDFSEI